MKIAWTDAACYELSRYPVFFDDIAARLLPVIPLIIYRLIENDAMDTAERLLAIYSPLLAYYPLRFTFVRDILAYFYGHLPGKLIVRILYVLDINKVTNFILFCLQSCVSLQLFKTVLLCNNCWACISFRFPFQSHSHSK